MIITIT